MSHPHDAVTFPAEVDAQPMSTAERERLHRVREILERAIVVRDYCQDGVHIRGAQIEEPEIFRIPGFDETGKEALQDLTQAVDALEELSES